MQSRKLKTGKLVCKLLESLLRDHMVDFLEKHNLTDSAGLLAINCRYSAYGAGVNAPRHNNIALLTLQITRIL